MLENSRHVLSPLVSSEFHLQDMVRSHAISSGSEFLLDDERPDCTKLDRWNQGARCALPGSEAAGHVDNDPSLFSRLNKAFVCIRGADTEEKLCRQNEAIWTESKK